VWNVFECSCQYLLKGVWIKWMNNKTNKTVFKYVIYTYRHFHLHLLAPLLLHSNKRGGLMMWSVLVWQILDQNCVLKSWEVFALHNNNSHGMFNAFFYYYEFGNLTETKYRHFPTHVVDAFWNVPYEAESVWVVQYIGIVKWQQFCCDINCRCRKQLRHYPLCKTWTGGGHM
jgi:hypothetical protein